MNSMLGGGEVWLLVCFVPMCAVFYALYFLLSLPLRRQERARLFLDLVETGLKEGRSLEHTVVSVAQARDRSVGVRFHLIAAYLESGLGFVQALEKTPHFLPPQILAMLRAGSEAGDFGTILPACRQRLKDGVGQVVKAQNYLAVLALIVFPAWITIFSVLAIFVFPKYLAMAEEMEANATGLLLFVMDHRTLLVWSEILVALGFYAGMFFYIGGPRVTSWLERFAPGLMARLVLSLPWRRKRIQRDFSAMLAVLLDAGFPEAKAVTLAAKSTANRLFQAQADAVRNDLERGVKLTEAVQRLDSSGEFRWRLANAIHGQGGFLSALSGWHEALDAQAFRQEQTAAQLLTTGLVFLVGLFVGVLAVAIFQVLIAVIDAGVLW